MPSLLHVIRLSHFPHLESDQSQEQQSSEEEADDTKEEEEKDDDAEEPSFVMGRG